MAHQSAHREMQDAVQQAYDRGRADQLADDFAYLVELLATLSPQEIERAFAEKFGAGEEGATANDKA